MFQRIEIRLTSPLCSCDKQDVSWGIYPETNHSSYGLTLECQTCHTVLRVPHDKFLALVMFDKPYPGGKKPDTKPNIEVDKNLIKVDFKRK